MLTGIIACARNAPLVDFGLFELILSLSVGTRNPSGTRYLGFFLIITIFLIIIIANMIDLLGIPEKGY
jgi:uncharacterized membrane protein